MKNKKITALITSFMMMLSANTAALSCNAVENPDTASAASQEEIHYCEMCGAELPEGTLPSPIGVWVCDDCHAQGMGGTTIPRKTSTTTAEITTSLTTTPDGDGQTVTTTTKTLNNVLAYPYTKPFELKIDCKNVDTNKGAANIDMDLTIIRTSRDPDGSNPVVFTKTEHLKTGKDGSVTYTAGLEMTNDAEIYDFILTPLPPEGLRFDESRFHTTALSYYAINVERSSEVLSGNMSFDVTEKPCPFFEYKLMCYDDNTAIDGSAEAVVKVEFENGDSNIDQYFGGNYNSCYTGRMKGTISVISCSDDYVIDEELSKQDFPLNGGTIILYLRRNKEVVEPVEGEEYGIYVCDIDTGEFIGCAYVGIYYDDYTEEEFFTPSYRPVIRKHDGRTGTITLRGVPNGYSIVGSNEFNFVESTQYVRFYVQGYHLNTTTTTETTTTTTTTIITNPCTTTSYIRTSPVASLNLEANENIAPGINSNVRYSSFMVSWIEISSDNAFLIPSAKRIEVENNGKGYFGVTCLEGAPEGTGTITARYNNWLTGEIAEESVTFTISSQDIYSSTTATTVTEYPGQYHKQINISEEIVLAADESGIVFENSGEFAMTEFARSVLGEVKPGMKVNVRIMYDIRADKKIINAGDLCITKEKCKVKRTLDGDANCDGEVNMADAVLIMQAVMNPDKYGAGLTTGINLRGEANADSDGNGLTQMDALRIQRSKLGIV